MNPLLRKVALFVLLLVPLFLVCFLLYLAVLPTYQRVLLATTNAVTLRLDPATELVQRHDGGWRGYVFSPEAGRKEMRGWDKTTVHLLLLSLVALPALLLSTPAPLGTRFRLMLLSLPLILVIHVLMSIVLTRATYCLREAPGTFHCLWALRLVYTSGQLGSAALWVLLTWRYWFPRPTGEPDAV
jgi:hypothetical protein